MSLSGISFSGIGSGIDTASIVEKLMALESIQQTAIKTRQSKAQNLLSGFQTMNTKFMGIRTAAEALNLGTFWKLNAATSSSDTHVKASANSAAQPGSVSFAVKNLAAYHSMASSGTVNSLDAQVTAGGNMLSGDLSPLGIGSFSSTTFTDGNHTVAVTQSSSAATIKGTATAASITFNGSELLRVQVDGGGTQSLAMRAGTYTREQVAAMVTDVAGGQFKATVNADNSLQLTTYDEGSASKLRITGGGLAQLGLAATGTVSGTNGIVEVDGVATTVTNVQVGSTTPTTLATATGTMNVTFSSGLRAGSETISSVDLGDGSLREVIENINNSDVGYTAQAIQVTPGQYRLQLTATGSGVANAITLDPNKFADGPLGSLQTITEAEDATLVFGTGAFQYEVKSASNTVKDVIEGVTLELLTADPAKQITITTKPDGEKMVDKVQKMVDAYNEAAKFINQNSQYNPATKVGGPLLGDAMTSNLQSGMVRAMSYQVGGAELGAMGNVGLELTNDGLLTFDKEKFKAAFAEDPDAVTKLFVSGGMDGIADPNNPGIAERMLAVAKQATDSVSGAITSRIKSTDRIIEDYTKQIDAWTLRLDMRKKNLLRQFGAMESAISAFQAQGNYLAGQLASLNPSSSK